MRKRAFQLPQWSKFRASKPPVQHGPTREEQIRQGCRWLVLLSALLLLLLRLPEFGVDDPLAALGLAGLTMLFYFACAAGSGYALRQSKKAFQAVKEAGQNAEPTVKAWQATRRGRVTTAKARQEVQRSMVELKRRLDAEQKQIEQLQQALHELPQQAEEYLVSDSLFRECVG